MNNKIFNEIKLKMVMEIHGLSRQGAKKKMKKENSVRRGININRDNGDDLLSAEEFLGKDEFFGA